MRNAILYDLGLYGLGVGLIACGVCILILVGACIYLIRATKKLEDDIEMDMKVIYRLRQRNATLSNELSVLQDKRHKHILTI